VTALVKNIDMAAYQPTDFVFKSHALKYVYHAVAKWEPAIFDFRSYTPKGKILIRRESEHSVESITRPSETSVISLMLSKKAAQLSVAAKTKAECKRLIEHFRAAVPEAVEPVKDAVHVKFWYLTNQGPSYLSRTINVPDWPKIANNYEKTTQGEIDRLFHEFTPSLGGQLILWQGIPGTGKTYALRSLCDAWRDWCSIEYIVDPEAFFGGSSSYLINLLADSNDVYDDEGDTVIDDPTKKDWKLFILEDTGELLSSDAKEKTGQGLARLLNVVDGFIGQGLKILVLITSNEELGRLHPAVSRPGRCAAIVEFKSLDKDHAREWAKEKGIKLPQDREYSLAELYSLMNNFDNKAEAKNLSSLIGFKVPA
jgi:hypothetical protein